MRFFVGFDERQKDGGIFLFFGSGMLLGSELIQNGEVVLMLAVGGDGSGGADGKLIFFRNGNDHFSQSFSSYSA